MARHITGISIYSTVVRDSFESHMLSYVVLVSRNLVHHQVWKSTKQCCARTYLCKGA